jgi:hypothetical protein
MPTVHMRTIGRAAELAGGLEALARQLGVPADDIESYIKGTKEVPTEVFLRATDIVMGDASKKLDS